MAKSKKGETLECVPCGREVTVSKEGRSLIPVYCCGTSMKQKTKAAKKKKITSTTTAKKTTKQSVKKYWSFLSFFNRTQRGAGNRRFQRAIVPAMPFCQETED
jgi:hypothetical protein